MTQIRSWTDLKQVIIITILTLFVISAGERLGCERLGSLEPRRGNLNEAAKRGDIEAVRQHLADETDVNAKDERGFTALHHSVLSGHSETVMVIIDNGADVNAKDTIGMTALDMAAQQQTIDLLRKNGAKTAWELKAEGN